MGMACVFVRGPTGSGKLEFGGRSGCPIPKKRQNGLLLANMKITRVKVFLFKVSVSIISHM